MSAPTYSQFAARFPSEAVLSSDATIQAWIAARCSYWWGTLSNAPDSDQRAEAAMLRAAHERQLAVDRSTTVSGGALRQGGRILTARSAGEWSNAWSGVATSGRTPAEVALMQSDYGQAFLALIEGWPTLPVVGGYV